MITGSLVAIVTPMHEDGRLDLGAFRKLIDWHAEEGTDGIADQPRDQPGAKRVVNEKYAGGNEQSAQAAEQAEPERNPERRHALEFYDAT